MAMAIEGVNALSEMLERTDEVISGITSQITTIHTRVEKYQEQLGEIAQELRLSRDRAAQREADVAEAEALVRHAQTVTNVSRGTSIEHITAAGLQEAQSELSVRQQRLHETETSLAKLEKKLDTQQVKIRQAMSDDELSLVALEQEQREMEQLRVQTHAQLGQAIYDAMVGNLQDLQETADSLDEALRDNRLEYLTIQLSLSKRLAPWPDLARVAQAEYGRRKEVDQREDETTKLVHSLINTWDALKGSLKVQPAHSMSRIRMQYLVTIGEGTVQMLFGTVATPEERWGVCQQRQRELSEWLQEYLKFR